MSWSGGAVFTAMAFIGLSLAAEAFAQAAPSVSTSTAGTSTIGFAEIQGSEAPVYAVTVHERRPRGAASELQFSFDPIFASAAGQTGAELLARAPGVVVTQHSGEGKAHQIFLRGFDAVHGQDVEITVGGIPINEPSNIHGQGYADLHFLIAEGVRRLHVLEGPFSARQGDFAIAGSFAFELGLAQRGVLARTSFGSFGQSRALVAWGPRGLPDASFVMAEVARTNGFGPSRASERGAAMAQIELPFGPGFSLRALGSTYHTRFEAAGVLRLDELEAGRVGFFDAPVLGQGGLSGRHQALLELRKDGVGEHASVSSYLVLRDLELRQNFTGFLLDEIRGDMNEQRVHTLTAGGRVRYERRGLFDALDLEVGASWRHDQDTQAQRRLGAESLAAYRTEVDADLAITDLGLYAQLALELGSAWQLRFGLRGEMIAFHIDNQLLRETGGPNPERSALGFHLAPKAGLVFQPTRDWELFLSYGSGFRSPQALSLSEGERVVFTVAHAAELGTRLELGSSLSTTLALFSTYLDEELQFDHATGTTLITGATLRTGATLLLQARPWSGVTAELAATLTHGRNLDLDSPIPFAPAIVLRAEAELQRELGSLWDESLLFFGRTEFTLVAEKPLPYDETAEPFLTTELSSGLSRGGISLSVELYNLFDARWRDGEFVYASRFTRDGLSTQVPTRHFTAGRPFTAQLSLSFEI